MTNAPEPASMAVLLREAARMMLQWASVFDGHPDLTVPRSTAIPTKSSAVELPPPSDADASFRRQAEALATYDAEHPTMAPLPTAYVRTQAVREPLRSTPAPYTTQELPWHDAVVDADRLPMTFRCPSCGQVRRWTSVTTSTPWPGAVCNTCYAERADHREGY